jgi:hypothetical protein
MPRTTLQPYGTRQRGHRRGQRDRTPRGARPCSYPVTIPGTERQIVVELCRGPPRYCWWRKHTLAFHYEAMQLCRKLGVPVVAGSSPSGYNHHVWAMPAGWQPAPMGAGVSNQTIPRCANCVRYVRRYWHGKRGMHLMETA